MVMISSFEASLRAAVSIFVKFKKLEIDIDSYKSDYYSDANITKMISKLA